MWHLSLRAGPPSRDRPTLAPAAPSGAFTAPAVEVVSTGGRPAVRAGDPGLPLHASHYWDLQAGPLCGQRTGDRA